MALTSELLIILKIFRIFGGFPYKIENRQFKKSRNWKVWSLLLFSVSLLFTTLFCVPYVIGRFMDPASQLPDYYKNVCYSCFHATYLFIWIPMILKGKCLLKIIKRLSKAPLSCYQNHSRNYWKKFVLVVVFSNVLEELSFGDNWVKLTFLNFYPALVINLNLYLIFVLMQNVTHQFIPLIENIKPGNSVPHFHNLVERINLYSKWSLLFVLFTYCTFILEIISFGSNANLYASGMYTISSIATIAAILIIADYPHDEVHLSYLKLFASLK